MQPPRRPSYRPQAAPQNNAPRARTQGTPGRDVSGRSMPRNETQRVMRTPQNQAPQEAWLMQKQRIRPRHVAGMLLLVCVFFVAMLATSAQIRSLSGELEVKKSQAREALIEVSEKERLLQFSTTDEYVEQQARLRFGYINADEIRFMPDGSLSNDFGGY